MSPDLRRVLGIQALALLAALLCILHEQAQARADARPAVSADTLKTAPKGPRS